MSDDRAQIKGEAERRGISRLCHFTQSRKLAHILTDLDGVRSVAELRQQAPDLLDQLDAARRDGHLDHICCSIEYPNTWYLRQIRDRDTLFRDWVILYLSPDLIWREQTLFSPRNAAAESGALIQGGFASFIRLFAPSVQGAQGRVRSRTSAMLPCCPTDDQAEVLVQGHIARTDIIGLAVPTESAARTEQRRLSFLHGIPQIPWYVAPALFDITWSDSIRRGQRPQEVQIQEPRP
jgi:hypothetical protein